MTGLIRITAAVVLCSGMLGAHDQPPVGANQRKLRESITPLDMLDLSKRLYKAQHGVPEPSKELMDLFAKSNPIEELKKISPESAKEMAQHPYIQAALKNPQAREIIQNEVKPELLKAFEQIASEKSNPNLSSLIRNNEPTRSSRSMAALDPRLQNNPAVRNMLRLWERNFGSLEKTPALKQAFADLLNSSLQNEGSGGSPFESEELNSLFNPDMPFGREMAEWLDAAANGKPWKWSDLGLGNMSLKLPEAPLPSPGLNFSSPTLSKSSDGPSLMIVLLIAGAVGVGITILRKSGVIWPKIKPASVSGAIESIDPASVVDRASLVRAFELLSLRILGRDSEAWNHRVIAAEFARRNLDAQEAVRLYEIARYSPPDDSIPVEMYNKARHCLSVLDGVSRQ